MDQIDVGKFPELKNTVRGVWAPIYLSPILGSPEQFVIAVAAVSERDFFVERANALPRLKALYGPAAEMPMFAAEVALAQLEAVLAEGGVDALSEGVLVFSGVRIGEVKKGEASSLRRMARSWMSAISSLYRVPDEAAPLEEAQEDAVPDRLPVLVHQEVRVRKPTLAAYFSEEIRNGRKRRSRPAGISIDYEGQRIVANFATLITAEQARSVDLIKRKMFDLIIRRDKEKATLLPRGHEMIVFSPGAGSPAATERQTTALREAHEELAEQSEKEEVGFVAFPEITQIGSRLVRAEFASGRADASPDV